MKTLQALLPLVLLGASAPAQASPLFSNLLSRTNDHDFNSKDHGYGHGQRGVQVISKKNGQCLAPADEKVYEGTHVVTVDCDKTHATWDVPAVGEKGVITLSGDSGLVIDAGRHPADGGKLSLYKDNGSRQQHFMINEDGSISSDKQCLDVDRDGKLQTYTCFKGNDNQKFEVVKKDDMPEKEKPSHPKEGDDKEKEKEKETVYVTNTEYKDKLVPTTVKETQYKTQYKTEEKIVPTTVKETEYKYKTETVTPAPVTKYETKYKTVTETPKPVTETKYDTKYETKYDTKYETKYDTQYKTKYETKYETKYATKTVTEQAKETQKYEEHQPKEGEHGKDYGKDHGQHQEGGWKAGEHKEGEWKEGEHKDGEYKEGQEKHY